MKTLSKLLAVAVVVGGIFAVQAKSLKVLMIGNSFSVCALKQWPQVAKDAGDTLDLASLMIGGCPLEKHWANVEKADDKAFKPYGFSWNYASEAKPTEGPLAKYGRRINLPEALGADKWDIITIQQASGQSAFYEKYQPFADKLIAKIRELAPQAEIVIQQTWSYAPYEGRLATWKMTPVDMYTALKKAYGQLAEKHSLRQIPTGDAVQRYRHILPVDYGTLLTKAEIAALAKPALVDFHGDVTGRSYWGKGRKGHKDADVVKLRMDCAHLNPEGEYLQALVWQARLFGTDVTKLAYKPDFLAAERAVKMRQAAMDAVNGVPFDK